MLATMFVNHHLPKVLFGCCVSYASDFRFGRLYLRNSTLFLGLDRIIDSCDTCIRLLKVSIIIAIFFHVSLVAHHFRKHLVILFVKDIIRVVRTSVILICLLVNIDSSLGIDCISCIS